MEKILTVTAAGIWWRTNRDALPTRGFSQRKTNVATNKSKTLKPTNAYARLHSHGLTLTQQSAVDLLAAGKNDTETADAGGMAWLRGGK